MKSALLAAIFIAFAGAWWSAVSQLISEHPLRSVFDLGSTIFLGGWVLGWSVGTFLIGIATVATLFMSKSLRVSRDCLFALISLGPLKLIAEYEQAAIYNSHGDGRGPTARRVNRRTVARAAAPDRRTGTYIRFALRLESQSAISNAWVVSCSRAACK